MKSVEEQLEIIRMGVAEIISPEELEQKLTRAVKNDCPLTIKLGLDPSAPDIHLGHAVVLRKIKQMQDLGHHAVIIVGDFTGRIGDPSGKSQGRKQLSVETVRENAQTYVEQIVKILDAKKTKICFNSQWLSELDFKEALQLAETISVARMLEREDFKQRYEKQVSIGLHEFFYPLMQGYDSVAIKADIEIGGTDQTFNILMGRQLQKHWQQEKQVAIFMPLLEGLDGVNKMSKSLGNYIGVKELPLVMFKKVMEVPDELIPRYFELATDIHPYELEVVNDRLTAGENPRDLKIELAIMITTLYHGEAAASQAFEEFQRVFQQNQVPSEIPTIILREATQLIETLPKLITFDLISSKSQFKRLVNQGGVRLNSEKISENEFSKEISENDILQVGKKRFVRFEVQR